MYIEFIYIACKGEDSYKNLQMFIKAAGCQARMALI